MKAKKWKMENYYYNTGKFDRSYVKDFEGSRLPMHRVRDRINYRYKHVLIHKKYINGLLIKYINKPFDALKQAYYRRVKDIKNVESFEDAFVLHIADINPNLKSYRKLKSYPYIVSDGKLTKNPDYERWHKPRCLSRKEISHNYTHIINPGKVRSVAIEDTPVDNRSTIDIAKPIYLGKLYAMVGSTKLGLIDVYHNNLEELKLSILTLSTESRKKISDFYKKWRDVKIGIHSLNYYKRVPDCDYEIKDFGLGEYLRPMCKIEDIENALNRISKIEE